MFTLHSNTTMNTPVAASVTPLRQSKRKRAQVTYYEGDDDSDVDSAYMSGSEDEFSTSKAKPKKRVKKEKPQNPFPFLSLPPELRNRIYELALVDPNGLVLQECWRKHRRCTKRQLASVESISYGSYRCRYLHQPSQGDDFPPSELYGLSPNILASCRQIYSEAAQVLYTQPFHFRDTMSLHHFLGPLSSSTSGLLRTIFIHSYPLGGRGVHKAMNNAAMTLLRDCTGLKTVRFQNGVGYRYYYNQGNGERMSQLLARQIYRDASVWLDRIGAAKALEILDLGGEFRAGKRTVQSDEQWVQEAKKLERASEAYRTEMESLIRNQGRVKLKAVRRRSGY